MSIHLRSHLESFTDPTDYAVSVGQTSFAPVHIEVESGDTVTFTSTRKLKVIVTIFPSGLFLNDVTSVELESEESKTLVVAGGRSGEVTYSISAPVEVDSVARKSGIPGLTGGMTGTIKVGGAALTDIPTRAPRHRARSPQETMDKPQGH